MPIAVKLWLNKWVIDKPTILGENLTDGQFGLYFERQKTYLHQDLDIVFNKEPCNSQLNFFVAVEKNELN